MTTFTAVTQVNKKKLYTYRCKKKKENQPREGWGIIEIIDEKKEVIHTLQKQKKEKGKEKSASKRQQSHQCLFISEV